MTNITPWRQQNFTHLFTGKRCKETLRTVNKGGELTIIPLPKTIKLRLALSPARTLKNSSSFADGICKTLQECSKRVKVIPFYCLFDIDFKHPKKLQLSFFGGFFSWWSWPMKQASTWEVLGRYCWFWELVLSLLQQHWLLRTVFEVGRSGEFFQVICCHSVSWRPLEH